MIRVTLRHYLTPCCKVPLAFMDKFHIDKDGKKTFLVRKVVCSNCGKEYKVGEK